MTSVKIEFPCDYPIKVIGEAHEGLLDQIIEIARKHDPTVEREKVTERASRNGTYNSITIRFWATGEPQLQELFDDLKECEAVRMVL
jgi:putative lipoic acid-binding regulatory protein